MDNYQLTSKAEVKKATHSSTSALKPNITQKSSALPPATHHHNPLHAKQQYQQQLKSNSSNLKQQQKEMISKSQSPHTSQAQKQLHYQQASQLFNPNAYGQVHQPQSIMSSVAPQAPSDKIPAQNQHMVDAHRGAAFGYGGGGTTGGVMKGLQQAPSMPYLVQKAAHEAYSLANKNGSRNINATSSAGMSRQQPSQKMVNKLPATGSKEQLRTQSKKILGVFTNYGGALSSNSNEGPGSSAALVEMQKTGGVGQVNRMLSNNGSVNSDGSNKGQQQKQQRPGTEQTAHLQNRQKKNSNKSQNSVKSQQNRINDNLYYPQVSQNIEFSNQNQGRSAGNSHDSKQSNNSKVSAGGLASFQSDKAGKKGAKNQTSSQKKLQLKQSPGQDMTQVGQSHFNNDYGMADNIGLAKGPGGSNMHHYTDKSKFAAYQTKIQVNSLKQPLGAASIHNRKTPKFLASSNMNLQNQASFGQKPNKQMNNAKTRNNIIGQNRTMQAVVSGVNEGLESPRFREQQYFHGSGGPYRVKTNKNSQEPRSSALTEQNKDTNIFHTDDPESEKQHKLRMKKKLLMSDSLQMLTKQRNQYLHHSINKSIQSKNNSQKSNQSREPRIAAGASITCVVGNEEQNDAIYSAINDQQIQTITMHNSINSSNNIINETHQSSQQSSITGSFNQPAQASEYQHHEANMSRKELSFRYKENDGRIEHVYSGDYTEPELIEGLQGDEYISSRRQTKHSPSFPQSVVTSANAGQTIVHSVNSQDNMSSTGTLMKNASGGAPGLTNVVVGGQIIMDPKMVQGHPQSQQIVHQSQMTKSLQQKAINVKKAMVKVSQGFKEKFNQMGGSQQKIAPTLQDAMAVAGQHASEQKQVIDKVEFAQKMQKVQDDIKMRNMLHEQREAELNRLQQDFQDQITDANKNSAQQSMMESSSRELTFQLKELERLQQHSQFESELPPPGLGMKNSVNENLRLNLKLNSHRDVSERNLGQKFNEMAVGKSQSSARFQNIQPNPNSDRFNQRQIDLQKQRNLMSQNLIQTEQLQQMGGQISFVDETLAAQQYSRVMKPDNEALEPASRGLAVNIDEIEEGCTGHDSRRAQLRLSHTPQADTNFKSQMDTSEQNYGHEISQNSQMTPTVGQYQPSVSSNQKVVQKPEHIPHNIKMRPLNLNQFQHAQVVGGDKFRKQFNFHAQLSSSRLSLQGDINQAKISERDAETERKGKLPSSRSSLMASQNIQQITHRSKLDRILNVKVTKKVEDKKSIQLTDSDTGGQKNLTNNSLNNEGQIQLANLNNQMTNNQLAAYGSGSKRGLNSRKMQYSDLKSPPRSGLSQNKFGGSSNQKYDEQIYMTIGQADPHPSQQTQIEMSASHLEQSNTSNINSSQASNGPSNQNFYSVDQRRQKKKFSTISHDNEASQPKNQINTMGQNSRVQKKIRINELPTSPRNKPMPQIHGHNGGLRMVKNKNGQQIYHNTIMNHQAQMSQQQFDVEGAEQSFEQSSAHGGHQVYENQQQNNQKLRRLQESRSLETNERQIKMTLNDQQNHQVLSSEKQIPSTTAADMNSQQMTNKKLKPAKKAQQNTLEFQLTGKGQYKLVKVKNRSQDPFTRKQDIQQKQPEDYNMSAMQQQQMMSQNQITESPGFQKQSASHQQTPQVNPQYNSRRTAPIDSSNKIMVVRSTDGQRKQIGIGGMALAKFGGGQASSTNVYESNQQNNEYVHPSAKIPIGRSQSTNLDQQNSGANVNKDLNAGVQKSIINNNNSCNGSSLSDNYANVAQAAKRANSTQSEQLKRSKINASQLFDNSFLCCLTQTKQKKDNNLRQYR